uniref:OX-2 membrane glycoprotein n=1 Tax=Phallusia mammillata TaxID=59560 RepID=A0A6F9D8K8_9ASCI|nr:OX-2 membrane glycoprotein [Phallusia mammillata]
MMLMDGIQVPCHGYKYLPEESDLHLEGKEKEVFAKHIKSQESLLLRLTKKSEGQPSVLPIQKYEQTFFASIFVAYSNYLPEDADKELTVSEASAYKKALHNLPLSSCAKVSTQPPLELNTEKNGCCKPSTSVNFASNTNSQISFDKTLRVVLHDISQETSSSTFFNNTNDQSQCSSLSLSGHEFKESSEDTFRSIFQPLSTHLAKLTDIYGTDSLLSGYFEK